MANSMIEEVEGIGPSYADVDTVKELATRNAANLTAKMNEVNAEKKLTRRVPAESVVSGWVGQAKSLPPTITH